MNKNKTQKFDLFKYSKSKAINTKKPIFSISSSNFKNGDTVELLKPSNIKNLYEKGTLLKIVPRKDPSLSPLWEIKLNSGEIEHCEENFLQKA